MCDRPDCPTPEIPTSYLDWGTHVLSDLDVYAEFHGWCCEQDPQDCTLDHPSRSGCVFCDPFKISGPISTVSVEVGGGQEWFLVFEPLNPVVPGHELVVPVIHVGDATGSPRAAGQGAFVAAQRAQRHEAANIITSIGAAATQTVGHLHWHVVPRTEGDGLHLPWTGQVSLSGKSDKVPS